MPWRSSAAMCSGRSRRARRPPWTVGCSVLTRPSSISGKPVCAATSVTARPAPARSFAVPPVESKAMPSAASSRASSTTPVLSETDISACMGLLGGAPRRALSLDQLVLDELAAQGVAVDAQPFGGAALVAAGLLHDHLEHRPLDDAQDHFIHRRGLDAAQILEVALEVVADALFDVLLVAGHRHAGSVDPDLAAAGGSRHPWRVVGQALEPCVDRARLRVARFDLVHRGAKIVTAGQAAQGPADVLPGAAHAGVFAVEPVVIVEVLEQPALDVQHT